MVLALVDDIRVVLVKLADRLHNNAYAPSIFPLTAASGIARETVEIYAPSFTAWHGEVRGELEDLAFRHLEPERFSKT